MADVFAIDNFLADVVRTINGLKEENRTGVVEAEVVSEAESSIRFNIVVDMADFSEEVTPENLTIAPNGDRYLITTPFDKGDGETTSVSVRLPQIHHHDFTAAKNETETLNLHPINFLNLQKGVRSFDGFSVDSDVNLNGLPHALHGSIAVERYIQNLSDSPSESLLLKVLFNGRSDILRQYLKFFGMKEWMSSFFTKKFLAKTYEASSDEDRHAMAELCATSKVDVSVYDLMLKLYFKTSEIGNRLVDSHTNGEGNSLELVDFDSLEKEEFSKHDIEVLLKRAKTAIATKTFTVALYTNMVKCLNSMPLRLNGDSLFTNFPKEIGLAKLVYNRIGESTKISAYKKFDAMGIASMQTVDMTKVHDSERTAKAIQAKVDIDILAAIGNKTPIIVVDHSGSMEKAIQLRNWLAQKLNGNKSYYIVLFGDGVINVYEKSQVHTIAKISANGNTPMYPAMDVAMQIAEKEKDNDPVIILISDLDDTTLWDSVVVRSSKETVRYSKTKPKFNDVQIISVYANGWLSSASKLAEKKDKLQKYHPLTQFIELNSNFDEYEFLSKLYNVMNTVTKIEYWVENNTLFVRRAS